MLSTPAGGYTSARLTGFRPDLLPSGLYRRPRSFTGSWGWQAFYALSVNCTGYLGYRLASRFTFPDSPALARALRTTPRGLYRRLGIGKARNQSFPHPAPKVGHLHMKCLHPCALFVKRPNVHLRSDPAVRCCSAIIMGRFI
jgi:hypothetical protein